MPESQAPADAAAALRGVEQRADELRQLAAALVRAPSPSPPGDERAVVAVLRDYLASTPGMEQQVVADDERRPNLICTVGGGDDGDGPGLGLFAHTDTVPVGDGGWRDDPFGGVLRDGRLYGRGTTDNKGAVAAMAVAFRVLAELPERRGRRLLYCANADEEQGGGEGIVRVADVVAPQIAAALVAEPSGVEQSFERLWTSHRGLCCFRIATSGVQIHAGLSPDGTTGNAAEALVRLWPAFRAQLDAIAPSGADLMPTVVKVDGGVDFGLVPAHAELWCDCRIAPGIERDPTHALLRRAFALALEATGADGELTFEPEPYGWIAPCAVDPEHPVTRAARDGWTTVLGEEPVSGCFPGGTDARILADRGIATIPGIGPGALARAHAVDEWVGVDELTTAAKLYVAIALRYFELTTEDRT